MSSKAETDCTCGNPEMGFDCVCEWVRNTLETSVTLASFAGSIRRPLHDATSARRNTPDQIRPELSTRHARAITEYGTAITWIRLKYGPDAFAEKATPAADGEKGNASL